VTDARAEGEGITGKRILCVEDSDDSLFMLHRRLTRAGFDVKVSSNGAESVEWAKSLLPDLIVMDLNLPGLDGWEATRRLKASLRIRPRKAVTMQWLPVATIST
jgi:two-component system cell cycle response regulator DivK